VYVYPAPAQKKLKGGKNSAVGLLLRKIVFGLPDPFYTMISNFCYLIWGDVFVSVDLEM